MTTENSNSPRLAEATLIVGSKVRVTENIYVDGHGRGGTLEEIEAERGRVRWDAFGTTGWVELRDLLWAAPCPICGNACRPNSGHCSDLCFRRSLERDAAQKAKSLAEATRDVIEAARELRRHGATPRTLYHLEHALNRLDILEPSAK